jgi:hypothetical protein
MFGQNLCLVAQSGGKIQKRTRYKTLAPYSHMHTPFLFSDPNRWQEEQPARYLTGCTSSPIHLLQKLGQQGSAKLRKGNR